MRIRSEDRGFTIAEMAISIVVVSIVALSVIGLFTSLVKSAVIGKRKAVASTLATNQVEYLKSLPYDSLVIAGGSIYTSGPTLPATTSQTIDNVKYTITTSISYVDDAYDGCGSYSSLAQKQTYCRNYPPPSGAPATDTNPQDYKIIDVSVSALSILASVDTQVSARVAETASTTGALFVTVIDDGGNPVSGANVNIVNSALTPALNLNDSTDENGVAIFYGLPPDSSGNHYVITSTKSGYSTLATIVPNGSLQPNFLSQNILTQQSSSVTMTLKPQGTYSLLLETTDTSGSPLASAKIYVKGGYKKYSNTTDNSYCYDNMILNGTTSPCSTSATSSDNRPTTDSGGLAALNNLVPGSYVFCGDAGATNCKIGGTTYYLAAAIPYTSPDPTNAFLISVPTYDATNPPSTTYSYNSNAYLQKVRLMLTTDSSFPRVSKLTPYSASAAASNINNFTFELDGQNLSGASVKFVQGGNNFSASCSGSATQQNCSVDLSSASQGNSQLVVSVSGKTLTLPATPIYGGINVGRKLQRQAGYTLSELMVVIVLIGILVSFTYTFFNMAINQYFTLQRDGDAFYSLSQHYQRLANVLRGATGITAATSSDLTIYTYFSPNDAVVSQLRYYVVGTNMLADVTPMTADPAAGGTPITAQKKTYTIISNFYKAPGVNTFVYLDANGVVLTTPIADLNTIKGIKVNLAVSSVAPNTDTQALTVQVSIRNRKTNL